MRRRSQRQKALYEFTGRVCISAFHEHAPQMFSSFIGYLRSFFFLLGTTLAVGSLPMKERLASLTRVTLSSFLFAALGHSVLYLLFVCDALSILELPQGLNRRFSSPLRYAFRSKK